jgi:hypothetical protein
MDGACSTNGEKRKTYKLLVLKPEGKIPLLRPILSWINNIKIYPREIEWGGVDWTGLVWLRIGTDGELL